MKKIIPVVILIIAVVAVVGIKNKKKAAQEAVGCENGMCVLPFPADKMLPEETVTEQTTSQPLPRLLDLGAGKCASCKAMTVVLDEMKESFAGKLSVEFIDVWENEDANEQYGIRMIPTQIFFDAEGAELFRHEGFYGRADMLKKWAELGYEFEDVIRTE